jgi:hypothetical protein
MGLTDAESIPFKYTSMSLNSVYETSIRQAIENIQRNGGSVNGDMIRIKLQKPRTVRFEKSFDGIYPIAKVPVKWSDDKTRIHFDFEGTGFVLKGDASKWDSHSGFVFNTELYIDGKQEESIQLPASFNGRRHELCWKYDLPKGKHSVDFKILNSSKEEEVRATEVIIYSDQPVDGLKTNL